MFKNVIIYTLSGAPGLSAAVLETALQRARFIPCAPTQPSSHGWVPPRGVEHGALVESVGGQLLLKLAIEQKALPAEVVKRRTEELAKQVEQETGRKPGRRQTKELKEQAELELLPLAFTKRSAVRLWIDPHAQRLVIDSSSPARAEEAITALVKAVDGFAVGAQHTAMSPAAAMSHWLASGEPPAGFSVDRECELKSADEMRSIVRYGRHPLDIDEVREHIAAGKAPTKLALTWEGRVSFVLTDTLQLKKLSFLGVVFEKRGIEDEDAFDADMAILTGELRCLLPDLIEALGGIPQASSFREAA
ncbi:recombination-associated protein RdgC [Caldimonas tepidiphila]|uniref:recombination-associated protein RdgC n=1 Tax=Caldimonas tepidiphila TaxID=2315841 RepID=UPI000E5C09F7|nr:recombination-associated protein RdgC [Caldimonas tepidiphila]